MEADYGSFDLFIYMNMLVNCSRPWYPFRTMRGVNINNRGRVGVLGCLFYSLAFDSY